MRKIAIITFIDYRNYGNRLQNYAVQELLESYGYDVDTVINEKYHDYKYLRWSPKKFMSHVCKSLIWKLFGVIYKDPHALLHVLKADSEMKDRINNNLAFTKKYISETNFVIREGDDYCKKLSGYDYFAIGSDQVWNPEMAGGTSFFYLDNIPPEKKFSIAASVGVTTIDEVVKRQWNHYLNKFRYISVREESAKALMEKEFKKNAIVHLDPTMLIEKRKWLDIVNNTVFDISKKYVLTYFLGDNESEDLRQYAMNRGLEIIMLNDKSFPQYYSVGPEMFLKLIFEADVVFTDSFHACVFSLIFYKPFFVFERKGRVNNISARIVSLLNRFGMSNRLIEDLNDISETNLKALNRVDIDTILEEEREKMDKYLTGIIGGKIND